ncbi:MAG: LysR family transcriptional regulator [Proteobacteria bacterium]|jgi:DNA-binding transcriptional LysR family regulator|nr:hypothetical protein [Chloroflexota bacterium]MCP4828518.1 LysR family transcriptional regulator [Pseudomonadota bacterium]HJP06582.1 LysR substrate-binding domain-containing protein [Arenicellales bacterium]|tara:strand:- start:11701 stop:12591 length:891 start_codon:yes stop_codon:yes gene_type:complete
MKHRLPPLDRFKVFERAATLLSFTAAAQELCVSKGAVSYQIRMLEQEIGVELFNRSVRQVLLTDTGQLLLKSVERAFGELEDSLGRIHHQGAHRTIRIAATTYVAARWLSPRVARFSEHFPEVSFIFQHSINDDDFNLDGVDIAIRWGTCTGKTGGNRWKELPMPLFAVASPALIDRYSLTKKPVLPAEVPLLCEERAQDSWAELFSGQALSNPRHVISDANVRVQAAIDGQGLILADAMMQMELDNRLLLSPMSERLTGYGYVFFIPRRDSLNPVQRSFLDWLATEPSDEHRAGC